MKISSSSLLAVSVNLAAAAVHTGPHPGAHTRAVDSWEEPTMSLSTQKSSKGKKQHSGNGGKHDTGVDGHHPGYNMSVVSKASKAKAHKSSKLSHPVEKVSSSSDGHSLRSKSTKDVSPSTIEEVVTSKAHKKAPVPTTVAPVEPTDVEPTDIPDVAPSEDSTPPVTNTSIPEVEVLPDEPEGSDTSVLKVVGKEEAVNVGSTGGSSTQQSKIRDDVNLQGTEQASMLSPDNARSSSTAKSSGIIVGGVCLFATAFYLIV